MQYGFIKVAAVTPQIRVADCAYNAEQCLSGVENAAAQGAQIICLPELCLTGYTCGDLFSQSVLQSGALSALRRLALRTAQSDALIAVGLPLVHAGKLYNCAAMLHGGRILGVVPKTHLPNYAEFYEQRHFAPAPTKNERIELGGQSVPFGTRLLFSCPQIPGLCVGAEICEDLWAPLPPGTHHAMAGATLLLNLSASDEIVGKAAYRRALVCGQSARLFCGYIYCDAGEGESSTDMVFAGHNLIAENGTVLVESPLFQGGVTFGEIDIGRLVGERLRSTCFSAAQTDGYENISFTLRTTRTALTRRISPTPFIPDSDDARRSHCETILTIQAKGLAQRMRHTNCKCLVLGLSGGLDSTLALLVCVRALALQGLPRSAVLAVTMPCFGTTERTRSNADRLCKALDIPLRTIPITATVESNFADIGHDGAVHDITYENTQARVRTLVLMNLANAENGLVVGTGDLSELALGWATYNGDHMSMYGVNTSVPKTLMRHLVATVAEDAHHPEQNEALADVLSDILATPVSPELLPAENGEISQQTEALVGPYALHDFFLYYAVRWAFSPAKIFYLARHAFADIYDDAILLHWLRQFYKRFFAQQFKRSCLPDGPKVGTVALSPRGDWRMPSDACATLWLAELDLLDGENE